MSGKKEDSDLSGKGVDTARRNSPPNVGSAQDDVPTQESLDYTTREARHHANIVPGKDSPRSGHSFGSNLSPVNSTPCSSSSSLASSSVKYYSTKENYSPRGEHKSQREYPSRRSASRQSSISPGGYSNERSVVRAGYNTYGNRQYYSPPPENPGSYSYDNDSDENTFSEKTIRRAFIRKVYALIACMMVFASAVVSFMMFHTPTRMFINHNMWVVIVSWASYPILIMILICCEKVRRTVPWNYFVLFLITLSLSFMAGCSAAHYNKFEVLAAFGITAVLCLGLTLFAFQTKCDLTVISGGLVIASLVMLIFGIVLIFWRSKIAMIGYACLGALLGCFFFIFDTQMMIGGNHRYAISPEEYVFAAITLFSDMINIFIMITNIIGLSRS